MRPTIKELIEANIYMRDEALRLGRTEMAASFDKVLRKLYRRFQ